MLQRDCETLLMAAAVDDRFALHPLDVDEQATCTQMADRGARVLVMPTHHINARGDFNGFRVVMPARAHVGSAAFSQYMFFGVSVAECQVSAQVTGSVCTGPRRAG
jgi:hypothetical protein